MSQSLQDKAIYLTSGLLISLGVAAFIVNLQTIQLAGESSDYSVAKENKAQANDLWDKSKPSLEIEEPFFSANPLKEMRNRLFGNLQTNKDLFADFHVPESEIVGFDEFKEQKIEVSEKENSKFHIYEIVLNGAAENDSIEVSVENHWVKIRGNKIKRSGSEKEEMGQSLFTSSFTQGFSVPRALDSDNVIVENQGQKVTLKFPKTNPSI